MMRIRLAVVVAALVAAVWWCGRALAVGWDGDDFLVIGAPNFSQYIGVFDHDFTFKGYLETNFLSVSAITFDRQGRLVATAGLFPEVRVYNPDGTRAGGFTPASSPLLGTPGLVEVAPDGNYVIGTVADGVRVFTPQGTFVRQYGTGRLPGVALVPGNRLWTTGADSTVTIFDFDTGAQVGTFTAEGQLRAGAPIYSAFTNTVLMVVGDRDAGGVYERDLSGNLLNEFHVPHLQIACNGAVRMPDGDVYATHGWYAPSYPDLVHWSPDGTVLEEKAIWPVQILPGEILWAGSVPEPAGATVLFVGIYASLRRQQRRICMSGRHQ